MKVHFSFLCATLALAFIEGIVRGENLYVRHSITGVRADLLASEERVLKGKGHGKGEGKGDGKGKGEGKGKGKGKGHPTAHPTNAPTPHPTEGKGKGKGKGTPHPTVAHTTEPVRSAANGGTGNADGSSNDDDSGTADDDNDDDDNFNSPTREPTDIPTSEPTHSVAPTAEPTISAHPTVSPQPTEEPTFTAEPTHPTLGEVEDALSEEASSEASSLDDQLDDIQSGLDEMKSRIKDISKDTGKDRKKTKRIDKMTRNTNDIGLDVRSLGKQNLKDTNKVNEIAVANQILGLEIQKLHVEILKDLEELVNVTMTIHDEIWSDLKECECTNGSRKLQEIADEIQKAIEDALDEIDGLGDDLDDVEDGLKKTKKRNKDLSKDLKSEKDRTKKIRRVTTDTNGISLGVELIFGDIGNVTRSVNDIGLENREIGLDSTRDLDEALEQLEAAMNKTVTMKVKLQDEFGDCLCDAAGIRKLQLLEDALGDIGDAFDDLSDQLDDIEDDVDKNNKRVKDNRKETSKELKETIKLEKITDDNNEIFGGLDESARLNSAEILKAEKLYRANQALGLEAQAKSIKISESIEKLLNETKGLQKDELCGIEVDVNMDGVPWILNAVGMVKAIWADAANENVRTLESLKDASDTIDDINDSVDDNNDRLKDSNRDNSKDLKDLKKIKKTTDSTNGIIIDIDADGEANLELIRAVEEVAKANQLIALDTAELTVQIVQAVEELVQMAESLLADIEDPSDLCEVDVEGLIP